MVQKLDNNTEYCDCLDWNESGKEYAIYTMNRFNYLLHTSGVTLEQRQAYYKAQPEYRESELTKELTQLVSK